MKTRPQQSWALALCAIALLLASCSGLPRYVRGDLGSRASRALPGDARFTIRPALAPRAADAPIQARIERGLRDVDRAGEADAGFRVWYALSAGPDATVVASSAGFASQFGGTTEPHSALLDCPDRFSQRLALIATEATPDGDAVLWRAALCSDGGGSPPEVHAARFAGELMKSFGMHRDETRFEFAQPRAKRQPRRVPSRSSGPPVPRPPVRVEAPIAVPVPVPISPATATAVTPLGGPEAATRPDTSTPPRPSPPAPSSSLPPAPQPTAEPTTDEPMYGPVGPTWARATTACVAFVSGPDAGCAVVVLLAQGTPILELGYTDPEQARDRGPRDAARVGAVFCETAKRHGLYDEAIVRIRAGEQRAERSCRSIAP